MAAMKAALARVSRREELALLAGIASFWGHMGHAVPWQHIAEDLIVTPFAFFALVWPLWKRVFPGQHQRIHIESVIRVPAGSTIDSEITVE